MEFQTALLLLLKMDFMVSCENPAIFLANVLRLACIIPSRNAIFRKFTSKIIICLVNISFATARNTCFALSVVTTCYSQGIELFALENPLPFTKRYLCSCKTQILCYSIHQVLIFVHSQTKNWFLATFLLTSIPLKKRKYWANQVHSCLQLIGKDWRSVLQSVPFANVLGSGWQFSQSGLINNPWQPVSLHLISIRRPLKAV